MIGQRVKIKCHAYRNGKTFFGTVKAIEKTSHTFTSYKVLVDGNTKATVFGGSWLQKVNP